MNEVWYCFPVGILIVVSDGEEVVLSLCDFEFKELKELHQ